MTPQPTQLRRCGAVVTLVLWCSAAALAAADVRKSAPEKEAKEMPKVFGLGPGRTGTESLKMALEELGFGPTYHMKEAIFEEAGISTEGHMVAWRELALGGPASELPVLLREWNSGTDWPLSAFPEELLEAFPDAKFVLTTRSAERWWRSMKNTVCNFPSERFPFSVLQYLPFKPFNRFRTLIAMKHAIIKHKFAPAILDSFDQMCADQALAATVLAAWNAKVEALIPKQQLLIFELGTTGYKELAEFLGVPKPDSPYPRSNAAQDMKSKLRIFWFVAVALWLLGGCLPLYMLYKLLGLAKKRSDLKRA